MRKRISTRVICLVVAAVLLAGALTVSAINGSPYEILKNATINAIFYDNFTVEGKFAVRVDGQPHILTQMIGNFDGEITQVITYYQDAWRDDTVRREVYHSCQYFRVNSVYTAEDGTQWYSVNQVNGNTHGWIGYEIFGPAGRNSNQLRLAELLADIVIGDLKNNLTINTQTGGLRRISGAITGSQLPEIIRILIDITLDEESRLNPDGFQRDNFNHVLDIPLRSLTIDRIQGIGDVDGYGNLLYLNIAGTATIVTIFGNTHVVEAEGTLIFSEIGTTVPDNPFATAAEVFAEAYRMRADLSQWHFLHFTLDENGNVDLSSMTEWMPGRFRTTRTLYPGRGH